MNREQLAAAATDFALCNPKWARPSGAAGSCYSASARMQTWLRGEGGADAHMAEVEWAYPAHGYGDGWAYTHHVAVLVEDVGVGGTVVDLTARQFDRELPFPWVVPMPLWIGWFALRTVGTDLTISQEFEGALR